MESLTSNGPHLHVLTDTNSALFNGAPVGNMRYYYIYRIICDLRMLLEKMISLVFVIKNVRINMSPILDGYRVMAA